MPFLLNAIPLNTSPSCAGANLLTKRKYCQPSLLRIVGERAMAPSATRAGASKSSLRSSPSNIQVQHEYKDNTQNDMDIFAAPLSSDEEEEKLAASSSRPSAAAKVTTRRRFSPPVCFPALPSEPVRQASFAAVPDLDDLFLSSQPKKKRKIDYTARNTHTDETEIESKPEVKFTAPAEVLTKVEPFNTTKFKTPRLITEPLRRSNRNNLKETTFETLSSKPLEELATTGQKFRMPTSFAEPDSSAPSLVETIFDIPEASQEDRHKRSGSTSSLSTHSSIEMNLTLAEQQALAHDDTGDGLDGKETERCDICGHRVERSFFRELTAKYKGTGIRRRQKICADHRQREAQQNWSINGYPTIDWLCLEAERIPKHIPHLTRILRRKAPSFYRTKLDSIAEDAKASRKALNDYLKEGIIHVARQGYYGPRGARVMGHVITILMEHDLKAQLKLDKVVRSAGVGGYVSAVLVPELMVELVKEDMNVETGDQARQILENSTKDGALLNGDDDEVVLRTDDD